MFGLDKLAKAFNPVDMLKSFNPLEMVGKLTQAFSDPSKLLELATGFAAGPYAPLAKMALGALQGGGQPSQVAGDLLGGKGGFGQFSATDIGGFATKFLGGIK